MDMSSGSSSSAGATATNATDTSMMGATLFAGYMTPLFSAAWAPASVAQYAGTCVFLVALAVLARLLLAAKARKEAAWLDAALDRRYVVVAGRPRAAAALAADADDADDAGAKRGRGMLLLSPNGREEDVVVVGRRRTGPAVRPWRLTTDPVRALLDTAIAGVGYLLMLAIMTMNVGYFMSVLGGVFLGSLLVGRYSTNLEH